MNRRAFTLIEALIAIALMAVVLPIALTGVARAAQAVGAAHRQQLALRLAQNKMNWLVATNGWSSGTSTTSSAGGDFDPAADGSDSAGFHWQLQVVPWPRSTDYVSLHLAVSWDPPSPNHQVALDTLMVSPALAAATTAGTNGGTGGNP